MFEIARKLFSENHPCKQEHIKDKIREGVIRARIDVEKQCLCGCGEFFITNSNSKFISGHFLSEIRKCACGCNETFVAHVDRDTKYINGHNHTHQEYLDKMGEGVSKALTSYLQNLTPEELSDRMNKSWGSCDHVARGNAISAGKKGKKTNQQQIMGERYATMTDSEFTTFLESKAAHSHTRIKNLRNKWIKQ